jgi:thioredoxin reductase (NADPH)
VIVQAAGALTGQSMYVERVAKRPTVEILLGTTVAAILGDARVTGVRLATGEDIACDAVFVYVGLAPQTAYMDGLLALDSTGRVPTDQAMATSLPGLFAAGLVRAGSPGRAAISANEARTAAEAADRWLRSGG